MGKVRATGDALVSAAGGASCKRGALTWRPSSFPAPRKCGPRQHDNEAYLVDPALRMPAPQLPPGRDPFSLPPPRVPPPDLGRVSGDLTPRFCLHEEPPPTLGLHEELPLLPGHQAPLSDALGAAAG